MYSARKCHAKGAPQARDGDRFLLDSRQVTGQAHFSLHSWKSRVDGDVLQVAFWWWRSADGVFLPAKGPKLQRVEEMVDSDLKTGETTGPSCPGLAARFRLLTIP